MAIQRVSGPWSIRLGKNGGFQDFWEDPWSEILEIVPHLTNEQLRLTMTFDFLVYIEDEEDLIIVTKSASSFLKSIETRSLIDKQYQLQLSNELYTKAYYEALRIDTLYNAEIDSAYLTLVTTEPISYTKLKSKKLVIKREKAEAQIPDIIEGFKRDKTQALNDWFPLKRNNQVVRRSILTKKDLKRERTLWTGVGKARKVVRVETRHFGKKNKIVVVIREFNERGMAIGFGKVIR
jgi:hypothetical protein